MVISSYYHHQLCSNLNHIATQLLAQKGFQNKTRNKVGNMYLVVTSISFMALFDLKLKHCVKEKHWWLLVWCYNSRYQANVEFPLQNWFWFESKVQNSDDLAILKCSSTTTSGKKWDRAWTIKIDLGGGKENCILENNWLFLFEFIVGYRLRYMLSMY